VTVEVRGAEVVVAYDGRPLPPRKLGDDRTLTLTAATGAASGTVRGGKLTVRWPSPTRPGDWFTPEPIGARRPLALWSPAEEV
jgi:hypothetical protein